MVDKITDDIKFKDNITHVIENVFPQMNQNDQKYLDDHLNYLINFIGIALFNYYGKDMELKVNIIKQFEKNNNYDIKWLLLQLLPNINENVDYNNIKSIEDIITRKKEDVDVMKEEPKYIYSNFQYSFCNETGELKYDVKIIDNNFYLLLNTINEISNKLFVNWTTVVPYTLDNYGNSNLFQVTKVKYEMGNLELLDPTNLRTRFGLFIGDIYNVLVNDFYFSISGYNWIINNIYINNIAFPLIIVLAMSIRNLRLCIYGESEDDEGISKKRNGIPLIMLDDAKILELDEDWNKFKLVFKVDGNIRSRFNEYDYVITKQEAERMFSLFIMNYQIKYKKNTSKIKITKDSKFNEISKALEEISARQMYDYLYYILQDIRYTIYGDLLLNGDKTDFDYDKFKVTKDIDVTNNESLIIYTYGRLLCRMENSKKNFSNLWCSLSHDEKELILNRLNGVDINFFHLPYDFRKMSMLLKLNMKTLVIKMLGWLRENIINYIFEDLIRKGILTELIPNREFSKSIFNNEYLMHSYNFLTELPYSSTASFNTYENNTIKTYDIFEYFSELNWSYSVLTWIGQLGFCHKFINNRVILITGSTGSGKSTQIPKLVLYFLKVIDYNRTGKVVCTEPRRKPTDDNATYISNQLGVPILSSEEYKGRVREKETDYYYVQMKHKSKKHILNVRSLCLKFETDGMLLLEITNPFLKVADGEHFKQNLYDVVMIDETHEHNVNMDMLLTNLKVVLTLNNSIRLVVLSATMSNDESRFRRYFRDINDNRKYPLSIMLKENEIDRICVDRHFHMSMPLSEELYKITDTYVPNKDIVALVMEIIERDKYGFILIFQPGAKDIWDIITRLNKILPRETIAIPYYSTLPNDKLEFIEHIDKRLSELHISKDDNFLEVPRLTDGSNVYNQVVIVATNILEASVTIENLKYVIDNGKQKVERYDYTKRSETLIESDISETSRIQRRGRVGRQSNGVVYYLYDEGKMAKNIKIFDFSAKNISMLLYKNIRNNVNEKVLFDYEHDFNGHIGKLYDDKKAISDVIKKLYYINDNPYDYFGKYFNTDVYYKKLKYYETGYDIETLNDIDGKFYFIHPDELLIKRNILGDIVSVNESYFINTPIGMMSKKILSFFEIINDYNYLDIKMNKSNNGIVIMNFMEHLGLDSHDLCRMIFYSFAYKCTYDILKLCALYNLINFDIKRLILKINNSYEYSLDFLKVNYVDNDSLIILDLLKKFDDYFQVSSMVSIGNKILEAYEDEDMITIAKKYIDRKLEKKLKSIKYSINEWCNMYHINPLIMKQYLKNYVNLVNELKLQLQNKTITNSIEYFENDLQISDLDPISATILSSYRFMIVKHIVANNYVSIYSPTTASIYNIESISKFKYKPKILINKLYLSDCILYMNLNINDNIISILQHVDPKYLKQIYKVESFKKMVNTQYPVDNPDVLKFFSKTINEIVLSIS